MESIPSILIVDSNPGFADMLKQSLEENGEYRATVALTGAEALAVVSQQSFDLAIVDLGINPVDELDGETVARELRKREAGLRLVLIPLKGEVLPESMADLAVQGILPKPFFLPDLPDLIETSLAKPFEEVKSPPEASQRSGQQTQPSREPAPSAVDTPSPETSPQWSRLATRELEDLSREVNAVAVLLIREGTAVTSVGDLNAGHLKTLAQTVSQSRKLSGQAAEALGREQWQFEQSMESDDYALYTLSVVDDLLLSTVLRSKVALGFLRHQVRRTARHLRDLMDGS